LPPNIGNEGNHGSSIGRNDCFELLRHVAVSYCQALETRCAASVRDDACCRAANAILQPDNDCGYKCVPHQDEAHKLFMQSTLVNGLGELPNENDVRVPVCTWNSCVYTLNATGECCICFYLLISLVCLLNVSACYKLTLLFFGSTCD
jgi:hypothetical protein